MPVNEMIVIVVVFETINWSYFYL